MKVFIVLKYVGEVSQIVDVYTSKACAVRRVVRESRIHNYPTTLHIISKPVKGLAGIKFEIDGKKRFLKGTIKPKK